METPARQLKRTPQHLTKDPKRHPSTSLSLADKGLDGVILRCWGVVFEVLGCAFGVPKPTPPKRHLSDSKRTPQRFKNHTPKALELRV